MDFGGKKCFEKRLEPADIFSDVTRDPDEGMISLGKSKPVILPDLDLGNNQAAPRKAEGLTAADVYEDNGGTILLAAVGNKLIIASDTRHSAEYNINSRKMSRIFRISDFFLCSSGFYADTFNVNTKLKESCTRYEYYKKMPLSAAASLMCQILYHRRFFPYRVSPCLAGFEDGEPAIYTFDCVGSYQKVKYRCDGSAAGMIQPLLDSWFAGHNFENFQPLDFDQSLKLIKAAFDAAAERDVKTKDFLEIVIFDGKEVTSMLEELRKD